MKRLIILMLFTGLLNAAEAQYQLKPIDSVNRYNPLTGKATDVGDRVILKGVVTGAFNAPAVKRTMMPATILFSLADSTGSIIVQWPRAMGAGGLYRGAYIPANGDSVMVTGAIAQAVGATAPYSGTITLDLADTVSFISNTYPRNVTTVAKLSEDKQAKYLEIDSLELVNAAQWTGSKAGFEVQAKKGANQYVIFVNANTTLVQTAAPVNALFNIRGIEFQADQTAPYLIDYFLMPTDSQDLHIIYQRRTPLKKIRDVKPVDANGIADSAGLYCYLSGIVEDSNLSGTGLFISIRDTTGAISLVSMSNFGYAPHTGDSILVLGTIEQSQFGVTEMLLDSLYILSTGYPVLPQATAALDEGTESDLVKIAHVAITNPSQWDTTSTGKALKQYIEVRVSNGVNFYNLLILRTTHSFFHAPPTTSDTFNITGIGYQADTPTTKPPKFLSNYILLPRMWGDFQFIPSVHSNFSADTVCFGNPTVFTNLTSVSSDVITSQVWNFGDSSSSTEASPAHYYAGAGAYTVTLKSTTASGLKDSIVKTVLVNPKANSSFSWSTISGNTMQFTAKDTTNTSYTWNFGDGTTSTLMDKEYTYNTAGSYTVSLTITNKYGCSSSTSGTVTTGQSGTGIDNAPVNNLKLNIAPNPFSGMAVISYELTESAEVSAGIYDITGKEIMPIVNGMQVEGKYEFTLNAANYNLSAGMYFLKMNINGNRAGIIKLLSY